MATSLTRWPRLHCQWFLDLQRGDGAIQGNIAASLLADKFIDATVIAGMQLGQIASCQLQVSRGQQVIACQRTGRDHHIADTD